MSGALESWKQRLGPIPGATVLIRAVEKSNADHAKDMAASIAYFSFFSLFPLLVGIVAGASLFLDRAEIQTRLDRMLASEFPGSADFLRTNIEALIDLRSAAGIASVVGLLWSGEQDVRRLEQRHQPGPWNPQGTPLLPLEASVLRHDRCGLSAAPRRRRGIHGVGRLPSSSIHISWVWMTALSPHLEAISRASSS